MTMYAADAGSRYIVRDPKLKEAYAWLEHEGEFAHVTGHLDGCTWLSADGTEDMFCGEVAYSVGDLITEFMRLFCEPGSYACHYVDDFDEYGLYWVDGDGVHQAFESAANPFAGKIAELRG